MSYQDRKSHCGKKRKSDDLHNRISYTGKTAYLGSIRAQVLVMPDLNASSKLKLKISASKGLIYLPIITYPAYGDCMHQSGPNLTSHLHPWLSINGTVDWQTIHYTWAIPWYWLQIRHLISMYDNHSFTLQSNTYVNRNIYSQQKYR